MSHTSAHQIYKIFWWQLKINGKVRCNKLAQKHYYTIKRLQVPGSRSYNHFFQIVDKSVNDNKPGLLPPKISQAFENWEDFLRELLPREIGYFKDKYLMKNKGSFLDRLRWICTE